MDFDGPTPDARIRGLRAEDLDRLVELDAEHTGRQRREFFKGRLRRALEGSDVQVSLGAELDGRLIGAMLAQVQYGEYGVAEAVAVLDTVLVDRAFAGRGVAVALMAQLRRNLRALRVERIRTEVAWDQQALLGFLAHEGFQPAPRLVLECAVEP